MKATLKLLSDSCKNKFILFNAVVFTISISLSVSIVIPDAIDCFCLIEHYPTWYIVLNIIETILIACLILGCFVNVCDGVFELRILEQPVRCDHGVTIPEVIHNLRHLPHECLAIFDENESKITEYTCYSPSTVVIPSCESDFHLYAATFRWQHSGEHFEHVHNHPSSYSAHSGSDIAFAIQHQSVKSIVVTHKMIYTIELPPECWQLDPEEIRAEYDHLFQKACKANRLYCRNRTILIGAQTVTICQCLAEKYGFKFTAELYKKSDFYRRYRTISSQTSTLNHKT